jgi:hypothetical protein
MTWRNITSQNWTHQAKRRQPRRRAFTGAHRRSAIQCAALLGERLGRKADQPRLRGSRWSSQRYWGTKSPPQRMADRWMAPDSRPAPHRETQRGGSTADPTPKRTAAAAASIGRTRTAARHHADVGSGKATSTSPPKCPVHPDGLSGQSGTSSG